jgi:hypothetical protein
MESITRTAAKRIEELPHHLHREFPHVPISAIEHDVSVRARNLVAGAHFDDYIPLLVQRYVRERLQALN